MDAEGGSKYPWRSVNGEGVRQRSIAWNPSRDAPPAPGEWETCIVNVLDYTDLTNAYAWLNSGQHPFRSIGVDSLTFAQKRCKDMVAGLSTLSDREWGDLLLKMDHLVRYFCDLRSNPVRPVECITFLALTEVKAGIRKPAIQGGLSVGLPGYVDLEGYLYADTVKGLTTRKLLISPVDPTYQVKDRTHVISKHYGPVITNPDIEEMLAVKEAGENG